MGCRDRSVHFSTNAAGARWQFQALTESVQAHTRRPSDQTVHRGTDKTVAERLQMLDQSRVDAAAVSWNSCQTCHAIVHQLLVPFYLLCVSLDSLRMSVCVRMYWFVFLSGLSLHFCTIKAQTALNCCPNELDFGVIN